MASRSTAPWISRATRIIRSTAGVTEHFRLFAPRVGIAYRVNDKTVIRTGGGIYFLPSTTGFSEAPWGLSINQLGNPWLATLDSGVTPYYPISDPFPNGFTPAPANLPRDQAQLLMVGTSLGNIPLATVPYPYQAQWNFSVQRQFWGGVAVDAAYAGSTRSSPAARQPELRTLSRLQLPVPGHRL